MSATNLTKNLKLSQFVASDKPSWLGDVNGDNKKIDDGYGVLAGEISKANDTASSAKSQSDANTQTLTNVNSELEDYGNRITALEAGGGTEQLEQRVNTLGTDVETLQTKADTFEENIAQNGTDITALKGRVDTIEPKVKANDDNLTNLMSTINRQDERIANLTTTLEATTTTANTAYSTAQRAENTAVSANNNASTANVLAGSKTDYAVANNNISFTSSISAFGNTTCTILYSKELKMGVILGLTLFAKGQYNSPSTPTTLGTLSLNTSGFEFPTGSSLGNEVSLGYYGDIQINGSASNCYLTIKQTTGTTEAFNTNCRYYPIPPIHFTIS